MSEYWKSTPRYWCKHCKTFVKDTKFEKTNHEATPKHQGNLKRFLRDLHKGHEREERDQQRAKNEVDRLNGVVSESRSKNEGTPWDRKPAIPAHSTLRQATPADRKKQLAQLAELGVAVPEDFRKEMAMPGDWQTTSERLIYDRVKKEEDAEDVKPEGLNVGVRKRKFEGQEEEEEVGGAVVRRGWGSTIRAYPGATGDGEDDLDALLNTTKTISRDGGGSKAPAAPNAPSQARQMDKRRVSKEADVPDVLPIKREESSENPAIPSALPACDATRIASIKQEEEGAELGVVFKKRKAKPIRQK